MRISTAQMHQTALTGILDQQSQLSKIQQQIASGKRIQSAADDPSGMSSSLQLTQAVALTEQYQKNGDLAKDRISQEEQALGQVNTVLDRVRELTLQGNNGTLGAKDRQMIVAELNQRLDELLAFSNTKDAVGEYLFAGYQSHTQPFSQNGNGVVAYNGDDGQRYVQIGHDRQLAVTDSGNHVFRGVSTGNGDFVTAVGAANTGSGVVNAGRVSDATAYHGERYTLTFTAADTYEVRDAGGNLVKSDTYVAGSDISFSGIQFGISGTPATGDTFTVSPSTKQDVFGFVKDAIDALSIVEDTPQGRANRATLLGQAISGIDQSQENIRGFQAEVGARLNALQSQADVNDSLKLQYQSTLSSLNDLDYADAITKLNQYMVGLQAAQQSYTRIQGLSLFNYL